MSQEEYAPQAKKEDQAPFKKESFHAPITEWLNAEA
jgi:hypothetical protein